MSVISDNVRSALQRAEFRRRWGTFKKSFEGVSWFFIGTVFIFVLGVIFFILGVIFLAPSHSSEQTVGIIFLVIGIVGTLLGIVTFLIRCFCPQPRSSRSTTRSQVHRHRGQRVPTTNNRGGGVRRNSQQRVWSTVPPLAASTPTIIIDNSFNRSIDHTLSNAPPTYDEAIGRSSISIADAHPPPYNIP